MEGISKIKFRSKVHCLKINLCQYILARTMHTCDITLVNDDYELLYKN